MYFHVSPSTHSLLTRPLFALLSPKQNRWWSKELLAWVAAASRPCSCHLGRHNTPSHALQPLTIPQDHLSTLPASSQSAQPRLSRKRGPTPRSPHDFHTRQNGLDQTHLCQRQSPPPPPLSRTSPPSMSLRACRRVVHGAHPPQGHDNRQTKSSRRSPQLAADSWINGTSLFRVLVYECMPWVCLSNRKEARASD